MAKSLLRFLDNDGDPIADAITVVLNGPLEGTPADYGSVKEPVAGNENGARIFTDLPQGSYNLKFDGVVQTNLSPMWISGPGTTIGAGEVDTTNIADSAVTTAKLNDGAVTADKIGSNAITNAKLYPGAVTIDKLASDSIAASKIVDASITKAKLATSVFNSMMVDSGGYGPKVDGNTLASNTSGQLYVNDEGISTLQLANAAVTNIKLANNAVSSTKIADDAVSSTKLVDLCVTNAKIAENTIQGSKIKASQLEVTHLTPAALIALRAAANYVATGTAYVSPNFAGSEAPYFDDLQAAIDYIIDDYSGDSGTVLIYPGTYFGPFEIDGSISLIGLDNQRAQLMSIPTISHNAVIDITAIGSENILLQNLKIMCLSNNADATKAVGIRAQGISAQSILINNINMIVSAASHASAPRIAVGFDAEDSVIDIVNSYMFVKGGNNSGGGAGAEGRGIELNWGNKISFTSSRMLVVGGTGTPNGKGTGWYYTGYGDMEGIEIDVVKCIVDSDDEAIGGVPGVTVSPTVISSVFKNEVDVGVISKTKFVNTEVSEYVQVRSVT